MANKVILIGNVGKDAPIIKTFDWGKVATFSLATTERGYKTKDGREIPETTDWHKIVVRGGLATVVEKYVRGGSKLYVEGKVRYRSYDDNNGAKKFVTEINAENLELLGGKFENQQAAAPQQQPQRQPQPQYEQPQSFFENGDDEIPF